MLLTLYAALLVGMVGLIGFGYWLGANTRSRSTMHTTTDTDPRERPDITTQGAAMGPQTYADSERGQADE